MDNNFNNYDPYGKPIENNETENQETQNDTVNGTNKKKGFGQTVAKTMAIALVFGLVAGTAFVAVSHFGNELFGISDQEGNQDENAKEDKNTEDNKNNSSEGPLLETTTEEAVHVSTMDVSDIVENVMPCIVAITNTSENLYMGNWGQQYAQESTSAGTGFLVEQNEEYIYIATNNHVVEGAKKLTVQFSDETVAPAKVKGNVASKDLAVIQVALKDIDEKTKEHIRLATLGNSNDLEVGEGAIAIGNALGYGQSVTTGVISALGRSVTVTDPTTGGRIISSNLIQTDAAINPGNSGGALLNTKGEVIGINSVKYADTSVEGIGYAIPISDAMLIINKLISGEKIEETNSGFLGIQGMDGNGGVYVYKVIQDSPAEKAGICAGDIIVSLEGNTISSISQLKELLSFYPAGETVELVLYHAEGNEYVEKTVEVTLQDKGSVKQ